MMDYPIHIDTISIKLPILYLTGLHISFLDSRPQGEVQVRPDKLELVASFCYLGGMLCAGGGCEPADTTGVKTAWKKFRELLLATSLTRPVAMCTALACEAP